MTTRSTKGGEAWDFNARPMRAKAMNKMVEVAPSLIVIGQLRGQVLPDKLARHMKFSAEMATQQPLEGKYFAVEGDCDSKI